MKKVFISYRREDSAAMAGRLYDSFSARFGQQRVFFDVDTLKGGKEFHTQIQDCLKDTGVVLVVMGDRWHDILVERTRSPDPDYVAMEIESANDSKVDIMPVLVGKRANEQFQSLISSNSRLAPMITQRHARDVDPGIDYRVHVDRLIRDVESLLGIRRRRLLRKVMIGSLLIFMLAVGWGVAAMRFAGKYGALPKQALAVGLTSVEDRSDPGQAVPPEVIFRKARHEIFISGVSCYRTFDQHRDVVDEVVESGKTLCVLLMDPDSPDVAEMSIRLKKPIAKEIRQVMTIIHNNPRLRDGRVRIRLMSRLPTFTAVMIDGAVSGGGHPEESTREIRIQHLVTHNVQHKGVILVFGPSATGNVDGFDLYSSDLREQWNDASASEKKVAEIVRSDAN